VAFASTLTSEYISIYKEHLGTMLYKYIWDSSSHTYSLYLQIYLHLYGIEDFLSHTNWESILQDSKSSRDALLSGLHLFQEYVIQKQDSTSIYIEIIIVGILSIINQIMWLFQNKLIMMCILYKMQVMKPRFKHLYNYVLAILLLLSVSCITYIAIFKKLIICLNYEIFMSYLTVPTIATLIIGYILFLWHKMGQYNTLKHYLFITITISIIVITYIIYTKSKLSLNSTELIIDLYIIQVINIYSLQEKMTFLHEYLMHYALNTNKLTIEDTAFMLDLLHQRYIVILDTLTIEQIKEDITDLVNWFSIQRTKSQTILEHLEHVISLLDTNSPEWFYALRNSLFIAGISQTGILLYTYYDIAINIIYNFHDFSYNCAKTFIKYYYGK